MKTLEAPMSNSPDSECKSLDSMSNLGYESKEVSADKPVAVARSP